ncbi:hypothetical protein [Rhodococcus qingshengii]|uniref:hypothetical protein n=1 Tax=Rhodococcus qingshengii TaxID=334542 RepID=UPI002942AB13|nr:hypothetical protein [Rhodococcus qingshengii]WOI85991.1 hypothetical protein R0122_22695 [Rhodococcus qingshengii]
MSNIITIEQLQSINTDVNTTLGELVVAAVNEWIETVTNRCFGASKTVTELYDASGVVWLRHMDVTAITSIKIGYPNTPRTEREAGTYSWSSDGRLILDYGRTTALPPSTYDQVEVTYTYGTAAAPADLVMAALSLASNYANYVANGSREVSRAQVGSYTLQFAAGGSDSGASDGSGSNSTVSRDWQVIKAYAMRRV